MKQCMEARRSILQHRCPDELILEMVAYIKAPEVGCLQHDLLALSRACVRLHTIITPVLLNLQFFHLLRLQTSNALEIHVESDDDHDPTPSGTCVMILGAKNGWPLDKVYDKPRLRSVDYRLQYHDVQGLWSVHGLVVRAQHLRSLTVRFEVVGFNDGWSKTSSSSSSSVVQSKPVCRSTVTEWLRAYFALVAACSRHEGASVLVQGNSSGVEESHIPFDHSVSLAAAVATATGSLDNKSESHSIIVSPAGGRPGTMDMVSPLKPAAFPTSSYISTEQTPDTGVLNRLTLASGIPFTPSFYLQTQHLIHASSSTLTQLRLRNVQQLLHYDWHQILPSWPRLARLEEFATGEAAIAWPDLLAFLCRHPTIAVLDLARNVAIGRVPRLGPDDATTCRDNYQDLLPNLKRLVASPEYVVPFLGGGGGGGGMSGQTTTTTTRSSSESSSWTRAAASHLRTSLSLTIGTACAQCGLDKTSSFNAPVCQPFPKLQSVTVTEEAINPHRLTPPDFAQILRLVAARETITELAFTFLSQSPLREWPKLLLPLLDHSDSLSHWAGVMSPKLSSEISPDAGDVDGRVERMQQIATPAHVRSLTINFVPSNLTRLYAINPGQPLNFDPSSSQWLLWAGTAVNRDDALRGMLEFWLSVAPNAEVVAFNGVLNLRDFESCIGGREEVRDALWDARPNLQRIQMHDMVVSRPEIFRFDVLDSEDES